VERQKSLTDAYEELLYLASRRREQLEASRSLWQFFWDATDEEGWIKEKVGEGGSTLQRYHSLS